MKKTFFYLAAVALVALCNISCGSDDDDIPPTNSSNVTLSEPETSKAAIAFEIPAENALTSINGEKLEAVNITESGKALLKINTADGVKYVTCDAVYEQKDGKHEYTLKQAEKKVGTIVSSAMASRAGQGFTDLKMELSIELPGSGTLTFNGTVGGVKMLWDLFAASQNLTNIARTWTVTNITMSLRGDVDCTIIEDSGNLQILAEKAQDNNAELTEEEYNELCKTIKGITLDKTGIFSIEYWENSSKTSTTEACSWAWTDSNQESLNLKFRDSNFGNKYLNDQSKIGVKFYATGIAHFFINTEITGNKHYTATIDFTLQ